MIGSILAAGRRLRRETRQANLDFATPRDTESLRRLSRCARCRAMARAGGGNTEEPFVHGAREQPHPALMVTEKNEPPGHEIQRFGSR